MGEVEIKISDITAIVSNDNTNKNISSGQDNASTNPESAQEAFQAHVMQTQQKLSADPQFAAELQDMLNDPEIMELLQDGDMINAMLSMDPEKIKNDQNIQKLLNNPKMQEALDKASQQMLAPKE